MHLVGYLYEDYHDARSLEHKERKLKVVLHKREKVTRGWRTISYD
jgi:hypothetical protein